MIPLRSRDRPELADDPLVPQEKSFRRMFLGMMGVFLFCFAVRVTIAITTPMPQGTMKPVIRCNCHLKSAKPHSSASKNILGGRWPGLPPLPGLVMGNWTLIQRSDLADWIQALEQVEARYTLGGLRDDELEGIAGA